MSFKRSRIGANGHTIATGSSGSTRSETVNLKKGGWAVVTSVDHTRELNRRCRLPKWARPFVVAERSGMSFTVMQRFWKHHANGRKVSDIVTLCVSQHDVKILDFEVVVESILIQDLVSWEYPRIDYGTPATSTLELRVMGRHYGKKSEVTIDLGTVEGDTICATLLASAKQGRREADLSNAVDDTGPPPGPPPPPLGPPPGPPLGRGGAESLEAVFDRFDLNKDGLLDQREVGAMVDSLGYDVDAGYVGGLMGLFGNFDHDASGSIEVGEFNSLWVQLGGTALVSDGRAVVAAAPSGPGPPSGPAPPSGPPLGGGAESLEAAFDRFDLNKDGLLDRREVRAMADSLGYDVDADYVGGLMGLYGNFDHGASGSIEIGEFNSLWVMLGGAALVSALATAPSQALPPEPENRYCPEEWEDLLGEEPEAGSPEILGHYRTENPVLVRSGPELKSDQVRARTRRHCCGSLQRRCADTNPGLPAVGYAGAGPDDRGAGIAEDRNGRRWDCLLCTLPCTLPCALHFLQDFLQDVVKEATVLCPTS